MAQHDLDISNGSGVVVRADINDALEALGSAMKGPDAPPAPLPGMLWWEDDTPSSTVWTLRAYDGADWISMGTLDTTNNVFRPTSSPPTPQTSSGPGQWTQATATAGNACVLPASGSWAYIVVGYNLGAGTLISFAASVAAGGATIGAATSGVTYWAQCWRIA